MVDEKVSKKDQDQDQTDSDQDQQTFDLEYVRKLREESAKYRTQAKINAEAAKKLEEIENERKSDMEKATARAEKAERTLADRDREMLRLTVAAKHGITGDHLDLLHGTDEESLTANAEKLIKLMNGSRKPVVSAEGKTPKESAADSDRQFASNLFRGE